MSLQALRHFAVARTVLAFAASKNSRETRYMGLFCITAAFVHSPRDELQPGQGLLLRRALYGTRSLRLPPSCGAAVTGAAFLLSL